MDVRAMASSFFGPQGPEDCAPSRARTGPDGSPDALRCKGAGVACEPEADQHCSWRTSSGEEA
eukprot:4925924-Pyramimonas_sp.AAC.1